MNFFRTSKPLIAILLIAFCCACVSQKNYRKGMDAIAIGEYHKGSEKLRKAYRQIKDAQTRTNITNTLGDTYLKIGDYNRASIWYKNAIRRGHTNPQLNLLAAESLFASMKYDEAKTFYLAHLESNGSDNYARTKLSYCDSIANWNNAPSRYQVELLKHICSTSNDYAAFYSSNKGNEIILSSMRATEDGEKTTSNITGEKFSKLYKSSFDLQRQRWSIPELINDNGAINSASEDNGAATLSPQGDMLLFTRCETSMEHDMGTAIFSSSINRGNFANPSKIQLTEDSLINAHPCFSMTGDTLFFVSNKAGGVGGTDIWMSIRRDDQFSLPINMGDVINTPGNEKFPTTDAEGNLYFSSDTHAGYGGLDLFKANKDSLGNWMIVHLPIPINSSGDDFYLSFLADSPFPQGLFTSNRKGSKKDDIYTFVLPQLEFEVQGTIYNKNTKETLDGARVRIIATDGTDMRVRATDGAYKVTLKPNVEYTFAAYKDNFLGDKLSLNTIGLDISESFNGDLYLSPIDKPITINNINYASGSSQLAEESKSALDTIIGMLNNNPNITIELMSHTDHVGSSQANSQLSQARAQSVVDYLISRGISSRRLVAKGYGETAPVQVTAEIAQGYSFLKKGDVLTESFISRLSPENQDIAKSINRRTELKVLSTDFKEDYQE